jgi:hypothetical protein
LFPTSDGAVVLADRPNIYKVYVDGKYERVGKLKADEAFLGDGLIACETSLYKNGKKVADKLYGLQSVVELADGKFVALCKHSKSTKDVWVVNEGFGALAVAPDYRLCVTGEKGTHHLISTIINKNGEMLYSEPFYHLHDLSNGVEKPTRGLAFDVNGNLYVATPMGVQVVDHNGRVRAILSLPAGSVDALAFSGKHLFVRCGTKLFVRRMKICIHCHSKQQIYCFFIHWLSEIILIAKAGNVFFHHFKTVKNTLHILFTYILETPKLRCQLRCRALNSLTRALSPGMDPWFILSLTLSSRVGL